MFVSFTWSLKIVVLADSIATVMCIGVVFHSDMDRIVRVSNRSEWRHVRTSIMDLSTSKRNNTGMDTFGRYWEVCGRLR